MGINDRNIYAVVMAIAFATVAVAGLFLGIRQTFGPTDGPAQLIFAFEAVVIGAWALCGARCWGASSWASPRQWATRLTWSTTCYRGRCSAT